MKFAFNVAKSACGKKPVTLIADCMLSKLDKQKKMKVITNPCQEKI